MSCLCTDHLYQQSAAVIQLRFAEQLEENCIADQMYLIGDAPIAAAECVGQHLQRLLLNDGKLHVPSSLRVADAAASGRIQEVLEQVESATDTLILVSEKEPLQSHRLWHTFRYKHSRSPGPCVEAKLAHCVQTAPGDACVVAQERRLLIGRKRKLAW